MCDGENFNSFLEVPDHLFSKELFSLTKCTNCSFVFTSNAPDEKNAGPYYETEDYIEHSDTKKGLINTIYHLSRNWMVGYKQRLISRHMKSKGRVLDIGSASGYFLNHMKGLNYEVKGVEISQKARDLCKANFNIATATPNEWLDAKEDNMFSVVTMWHVMEHVYPIDTYLKKIHSSLNETGKAFIAMPNHTSFDASYYQDDWAAYDVPRHIWHFNPSAFNNLAAKHGFKVEKLHSLPLDPFYISMVSADYSGGLMSKIAAPFVATISSILSWVNKEKASSVVYVLSKATA